MVAMPEPKETLWTIVVAPTVWALHFLACYIAAAIHCAKPDFFPFGFAGLRMAIAGATLAALVAIAFCALIAWRQSGSGHFAPPHAADSEDDRHRFLGFAIFLLSGLSFVAVVFTAMPALFIEACRP